MEKLDFTKVDIVIEVSRDYKITVKLILEGKTIWEDNRDLSPSGGSLEYKNFSIATKEILNYLINNIRFG